MLPNLTRQAGADHRRENLEALALELSAAEVAEIDKSQEEATKLRQEEHDKFVKASADYEQSRATFLG